MKQPSRALMKVIAFVGAHYDSVMPIMLGVIIFTAGFTGYALGRIAPNDTPPFRYNTDGGGDGFADGGGTPSVFPRGRDFSTSIQFSYEQDDSLIKLSLTPSVGETIKSYQQHLSTSSRRNTKKSSHFGSYQQDDNLIKLSLPHPLAKLLRVINNTYQQA